MERIKKDEDMDKTKDHFVQELSELHQQVAELKVLETECKRLKEKRFESLAIIEGMHDAVAILDLDGTIRQVNNEFERGTGWKREEVIGKIPVEIGILSKEEDQKLRKEILPKLLKEGFVLNIERHVIRKDGMKFPGLMSWTLMNDAQGKPLGIISVTKDITNLKRIGEKLKESEGKYQKIFEHAVDGIVMVDVQARKFLDVNSAFCKMLGYTQEEMKQMSVTDIHPKDLIEPTILPFDKECQGERTPAHDIPWVRKDGKKIYTNMSSTKIWMDGKEYIIGFFCDITERKMAEEDLRNSEKKFKALAENSPNMIFINQDGRIVYVNKKCEEIIGYTKEEFYASEFQFFSLIAPEYQDIVRESFNTHMQCEEFPPYEYSIINREGKKIESVITTKLIDYEGGKAVLGIITDISGIKNVNEELHFLSSIVEQSPDSIICTDRDFRINYMNNASEDLYGWKKYEVIGKRPDIFNVEPNAIEIQENIYSMISSRKTILGESLNRKKNGDTFQCQYKISPIVDNSGTITGYMGFQRDITEQKVSESKLRDSEEKYRLLVENQSDLIVKVDLQGRILFVSPSYCEMFGKAEDELLGKQFIPLVREDDRKSPEEAMENLRKPPYSAYMEQHAMTKYGWRWLGWANKAVLDEKKNVIAIVGVGRDITERKKSEQKLEALAKKLGKQKKALEEKNIALREVLGQIEVEKRKMQEDIIANIDELILPIVKRLQIKGVSREYMSLLERNLKNITSSFGRRITEKTAKLTPREIEICNMLKNGLTSKEISNILNISFQTVSKHRKNIRKKLCISKKDINLYSFLQQL